MQLQNSFNSTFTMTKPFLVTLFTIIICLGLIETSLIAIPKENRGKIFFVIQFIFTLLCLRYDFRETPDQSM